MDRNARNLLAALTGVGLMVGGLAVGAPAAAAGTPNWVSPAEYRKISQGMTMKWVHGTSTSGENRPTS